MDAHSGTREWYFEGGREDMLRFLPPGMKSILDVGCASGNFLAAVGPGVYRAGIEPDSEACARARGKVDECFNGPFDEAMVRTLEARASHNRFDCIAFNDVLEHLVDPWGAVKLARRLLAPQGVVIASIPNFLFYSNIANMLRTMDVRYESAGIMDATHLRFFSKKSMVRMFEEAGYEVVRIEGISTAASLKFRILNALLLNAITDLRHMQFAIVAHPRGPAA